MKLYQTLDRGLLKKSYSAKMLFLAFLGIHVPLIGMLLYVILIPRETLDPWQSVFIILFFTLLATAVTLYLLNALLLPVRRTSEAMLKFQHQRELVPLPTDYKDEAGTLMANVHNTLGEIKRLNEDQLNFFSLLVHDLRSPLNSILSLTELMNISGNEKEREGYLQMIRDLSEKGLQVVQDTMHLIMNENYQLKEHDKQVINLSEFLKQQLLAVEGIRCAKDIDIRLKLSTQDKLGVQADLFSHIIQNLLTNAIKFSHPGGTVIITARPQHGRYHISVSDKGLGFKSDTRNKLFDRFTSEKKKGTEGEATSGIGLYLSRTLAEKHGGTIEAYSEGEGQGATFTVSLPYDGMQQEEVENQPIALVV